jgi:hypothetical protein
MTDQEYRVVEESHYHQGEELEIGETFVPTELEVRSFSHKIEPVEPSAPGPPIDPADHTVDELEAALDESDYSSAELDALETAEEQGKNRTTALDEIAEAR